MPLPRLSPFRSFRFFELHVRTQSWTGPPRAGEGGEEVIYVDIRHEPFLGKTSLKRIPLTCGIKYGYPNSNIGGHWEEQLQRV